MSDAGSNADSRVKRPVQFTRAAGGGLELRVPDDVIEALGWQDDDMIDLSVDAAGNIICQKIFGQFS